MNVRLRNGSSLRGFARNQGKHDIQLQTLDGRMHLAEGQPNIRRSSGKRKSIDASAEGYRCRNGGICSHIMSRLGGIPVGQLATEQAPVSAEIRKQVLEAQTRRMANL